MVSLSKLKTVKSRVAKTYSKVLPWGRYFFFGIQAKNSETLIINLIVISYLYQSLSITGVNEMKNNHTCLI